MVQIHLLIPCSRSLVVKHPSYTRHSPQIRERRWFESTREYQFKGISNNMLHLVISIPRSGSNSLCKFLSGQHNALNLYEPITDHRNLQNELTKPIGLIIKDLLVKSEKQNIVAKFHIDHLLLLFPENKNMLVELFSKSKLYYCFRLNFVEQIKSIQGITKTGVCDERFDKSTIMITAADANNIALKLVKEISIMGEWYKTFNGELNVLENMSETYTNSSFDRYNDVYTYMYESQDTENFINQKVDVLEIFNRGNSIYSLVRDVAQSG